MKQPALDSHSLQQLQALIAANPFLTLVDSRTALPQSLGTGLPLLQVETAQCSALISLQGAHLLQFKATDGNPLLWLSPNCDFTPGVALRGGVPLCLPWFGPHPSEPHLPKHGFARNQLWQLAHAQLTAEGAAELTFMMTHSANAQFGHDFSAELRMRLSDRVALELTVNNTGFAPMDCSFAFHNYFPANPLAAASVPALADRVYKDNFAAHREAVQSGAVTFTAPIDRVFPGVDAPLTITGTPAIKLTHENCPSVITWNPGTEAAAAIADIGAGQEQFYVCVERGAVLDETWTIAAGAYQTARIEFAEQ